MGDGLRAVAEKEASKVKKHKVAIEVSDDEADDDALTAYETEHLELTG